VNLRRLSAVFAALIAAVVAGDIPTVGDPASGLSSPITIAASSIVPIATIPSDFLGFSFDVGSAGGFLGGYFTPTNTKLIALMGKLGQSGSIRIGGSNSNWTPASSITTANVRSLHRFMQALGSGWTLIWGLNIYTDSAADAVSEVGLIEGIFGSGVATYQLGNEPDGHKDKLTQAQWLSAWGTYYSAIHVAYPDARFAGPDIYDPGGVGVGWTAAFVSAYANDVELITQHLYTNNVKNATLANYMLSGIKKWQTQQFAQKAIASPLPIRKTENNDIVGGGTAGLSNGDISIAWMAADEIFLAEAGWAGINIHASPIGNVYAPLHYSDGTWTVWPKFYAMMLCSAANGAGLLPFKMQGGGLMQFGMAFKNAGAGNIQFLVTNTDAQYSALFRVSQRGKFATQSVLIASGPSATSTMATLGGAAINADGSWSGSPISQPYGTVFTLPPASAALITLQ